jgi:hypothetical protein
MNDTESAAEEAVASFDPQGMRTDESHYALAEYIFENEQRRVAAVLNQINDDDIFEAMDEAGFDKGHDRSTASFVLREVKERVRQETIVESDGGAERSTAQL